MTGLSPFGLTFGDKKRLQLIEHLGILLCLVGSLLGVGGEIVQFKHGPGTRGQLLATYIKSLIIQIEMIETTAHIIIGHEVRRLDQLGLCCLCGEQATEVTTRQGVHFAVARPDNRGGPIRVDARQTQQGGDQVDIARGGADALRSGHDSRTADQQGTTDRLVKGVAPCLLEASMDTEAMHDSGRSHSSRQSAAVLLR